MDEETTIKLEKELEELLIEHQDLDKMIMIAITSKQCDHLEIQRIKKRKLMVKDRIRRINDILYPNIIA